MVVCFTSFGLELKKPVPTRMIGAPLQLAALPPLNVGIRDKRICAVIAFARSILKRGEFI